MKVMSIFGTRPEMIKMWATLKKLDELNFDHVMVHTGQNFTPELRDFFFKDLKLRKPDYELDIDTSGYGPEVADVIRKSDALMEKVKPDALLILGDTYSGLSVLPAAHRGIKIFHMEAGLARVGPPHAGAAQPHPDRPHQQYPAAVQPLSPREPAARRYPSLEDHRHRQHDLRGDAGLCAGDRGAATSSSGWSWSRRTTSW